MYEPKKLEDFGRVEEYQALLTELGNNPRWRIDYWGKGHPVKLSRLDELARKECFRKDAYEDSDRDDSEMFQARCEYDDQFEVA